LVSFYQRKYFSSNVTPASCSKARDSLFYSLSRINKYRRYTITTTNIIGHGAHPNSKKNKKLGPWSLTQCHWLSDTCTRNGRQNKSTSTINTFVPRDILPTAEFFFGLLMIIHPQISKEVLIPETYNTFSLSLLRLSAPDVEAICEGDAV
jgi:hypothetical protein